MITVVSMVSGLPMSQAGGGMIYVAFIIDVFAGKIVGPLSASFPVEKSLPVNGTCLDLDDDRFRLGCPEPSHLPENAV